MDKIKIRHINIIVLSLIILFNLITGLLKKENYEYYVYYIAPFIVALIICINIKSYKLDAWLFLITSLLCILIGDWGNLTGAIFLCFSFYCFEKDNKIILIIIGCTVFAIALKFIFLLRGKEISEIFNFMVGYLYIILIYFLMIHPKKLVNIFLNEDAINIKIIKLLVKGYRSKEIAEIVCLTQNAIIKRIENMRNKYDCRNNEQLIFSLIKNKKLTLN